MEISSIRSAISQAAIKRMSGRDRDMKIMLGDTNNSGIYMHMVSGKGLPIEKISHAMRNRLSEEEVKKIRKFVELSSYGLRPTEETMVDEALGGFGARQHTPRKLKAEIEQKRKVFRARENFTREQIEIKAKKDEHFKYWLNRLHIDVNNLTTPILNPFEIDRSRGERISKEVLERAHALGLFITDVPEKYGGLEFGQQETDHVLRFLPQAGGAMFGHVSSNKSIGSKPLTAFGTYEQKEYFIPGLVNGDNGNYIVSFMLTERNSGTNAIAQQETEARLSEDGKHFIINGSKIFSTNFFISGLGHLSLNIIDEKTGAKLPSVIELKLPFRFSDSKEEMEKKRELLWKSGLEVGGPQELSGIIGSTQAYWEMNNLRVPVEYAPGVSSILGGVSGIGKGDEYIFGGLNKGRAGFIGLCSGITDFALNETLDEIVQRKRFPEFGGTLSDMEFVKKQISEIAIKNEMLNAVSELTSAWIDNFPSSNIIAEAAIGKAFASEVAWNVAQIANRLFGGEGLMKGKVIEELLRDAWVPLVVEGVNPAMFQHGAGVSAGPALGLSESFKGKLKVAWNQIPFPFEVGDLNFSEALELQLRTKALSSSTMLKGAIYGKKMKKRQNDLYNIALKEALIFSRLAVMFKLKDPNIFKKQRAALNQYLKNTSVLGKESYPTYIGQMYIDDAKIKAQLKAREDKELLKCFS